MPTTICSSACARFHQRACSQLDFVKSWHCICASCCLHTLSSSGTLQCDLCLLQDLRSDNDSSWAEFDDLATERSSRLNSAELAQRPESDSSPFAQEQRPSTASSDAGGGWAAFGSDPPAFLSNDSTFQEESAAFGDDPSSRQSHQNSRQPSESDAQSPPSASWAAFDEPEPSPADSMSVGSTQQGQGDTSVPDNAQHSKPDGAAAVEQADEKPLPNAAFGESNYWRTHPLDLVDIVD